MIEISKKELLALLYSNGYEIVITTIKDIKLVVFKHQTAVSDYKAPHSYSLSFTQEEIELDCVYDLLKWSGLKVKYTLDY